MAFTVPQQKALAIAPKVSGILSMLGSLCIMRSVQCDTKNGQAGTYQRLLLGLSAFDVVGSFASFLSTWPIPRGTPGVWGAAGNTKTCTLAGLMQHFVSAAPLYNASIAVYFLVLVRYNCSEKRVRKLEPYMHGIPIVNTLGTALACIPLSLFNSANFWCWIAPFPAGCKDSFRYGDEADCIRGDNAWIYRFAFLFAQVWLSILISMVSMLIVYFTVLKQEKAFDSQQQDGIARRTQSRIVAHQSFRYLVAFYLVWIPPSILRLLQAIPGATVKVTFPHVLFLVIVSPLQGMFNAMIFFRAKWMKFRRDHPHISTLIAVKKVVFSSTEIGSEEKEDSGLSE